MKIHRKIIEYNYRNSEKDKNIIKVVALAIIIRSGFYYLPIINQLSSGFAMTISALTSAFIGAVLFNKGEAHG